MYVYLKFAVRVQCQLKKRKRLCVRNDRERNRSDCVLVSGSKDATGVDVFYTEHRGCASVSASVSVSVSVSLLCFLLMVCEQ